MAEPSDVSPDSATPNLSTGTLLIVRLQRLKILALRYWWVVAVTTLIGVAVKGYQWSQEPPHYMSTARMMVSGQITFAQSTAYNEEYQNFYGTQVALMKSPATVAQAKARVLAMHPDADVDDGASVSAIQEPRTAIFNLQVVAGNPTYAQLLLNAVMDCYLSEKRGRKEQTTDEAVTAIKEEISHLDTEIEKDGQDELEFEKENNVVFIEQQSSSAASYLVGLNDEMARLTKERDLLALVSTEKAVNPSDDPNPGGDPATAAAQSTTPDLNVSIRDQETNLEKLRILRQDYSTYLKDMHPKMVALSEAIDQGQRFLDMLETKNAAQQQAHLADLDLQIKNLQKQIFDWNNKSLDLNQRLSTYQQLKAKIARETNMYDQLAASFQNLNLNKSIDQTDVSVLTEATPGYMVQSALRMELAYGALCGVLAGIAITYFLHRLDDTIDSPLALREHFDIPLVGMIPLSVRDKSSKRVPLITEKDKRHILVESFRDIRSYILFRAYKSYQPKSILICSAEPNEGKSTLAANMAITFAMTGLRVLLIDGDLRRGLLHTLYDIPHTPGLSEYLQQQVPWQAAVRKTNLPTLDILPRGKTPEYAGELLMSHQTDVLFEETTAQYDTVVWDSVPLLAADDASNLCPKVEGIVFVVRARASSTASVRGALELLAPSQSKLLGIVLNAVAPNQPGYYSRYRYKNYYPAHAGV